MLNLENETDVLIRIDDPRVLNLRNEPIVRPSLILTYICLYIICFIYVFVFVFVFVLFCFNCNFMYVWCWNKYGRGNEVDCKAWLLAIFETFSIKNLVFGEHSLIVESWWNVGVFLLCLILFVLCPWPDGRCVLSRLPVAL